MIKDDLTAKQKALFEYFGEDEGLLEEIAEFDDSTDYFNINGETLLILTDDEADEMTRKYLESYIEDSVLPQIPEELQSYFDTDKYINDVLYYGASSILVDYNINKNEYCIDGEYIYIYKN